MGRSRRRGASSRSSPQTHRVVRYDRLGAGLSDRDPVGRRRSRPTRDSSAPLLDACGGEPATIFACSCAGLATARFASDAPDRVRGSSSSARYAARDDIPDGDPALVVDFMRVNWPLAAQMIAGLLDPHGSGDEIAALSRYLRRSAEADVAAAFLELDLTADARAFLPRVTAPALVLHRRSDRTVPIGRGRELASLLPNARFVALSGDAHLPWMDDRRELHRALPGFLGRAGGRGERRRAAEPAARSRCCASSPRASRTARSRRR